MALILVPGQNCPLPPGSIEVYITSGAVADFSAFRLYAGGKTREDGDFIFYGQLTTPDGGLQLHHDSTSATFRVDPERIPPDVEKIAFAVTSDFPTVANLGNIDLKIIQDPDLVATCQADTAGRDEAALILGEIYKRNGQWKFRFINQGFRGGLKPLAELYGVDIADDGPEQPEPQPRPAPSVNLGKVELTKKSPRIDLRKNDIKKGEFKINLNWHQGGKRGFFGRSSAIDLDLGAYVRAKNGRQTIVQALGDTFGQLDRFPFVRLMGDDRTGAQTEGEWIYINGDRIDELEEIIIYTFIYDGVPNWSATDGMVRIEIPGQPEIETRLTGTDNSLPMCAIASITNRGGDVKVERLDRYFSGHPDMDRAFGWGFKWEHGEK